MDSRKNFQVRPVEVDYLYTHFGSNHVVGYSASQNNFKYVTGVNFTFGVSKKGLRRPFQLKFAGAKPSAWRQCHYAHSAGMPRRVDLVAEPNPITQPLLS